MKGKDDVEEMLTSSNSMLVRKDLRSMIFNETVFTQQLTLAEQKRLISLLPEVDLRVNQQQDLTEAEWYRLIARQLFDNNPVFQACIRNFQSNLAAGVYEQEAPSEEGARKRKKVAPVRDRKKNKMKVEKEQKKEKDGGNNEKDEKAVSRRKSINGKFKAKKVKSNKKEPSSEGMEEESTQDSNSYPSSLAIDNSLIRLYHDHVEYLSAATLPPPQ